MSMDLNIRIISNLNETQQFLLYQQDIQLNVKNFKVAAWEHQYIAPNATFYTVLPMNIEVYGMDAEGTGIMKTQALSADYNAAYELYMNNQALDIRQCQSCSYNQDTIDVYNSCDLIKQLVASKDGKPLFAVNLRPSYKLNFSIHPRLYFALSDLEIEDPFFDLATLSMQTAIDYEGQNYLTIILQENISTGMINISYDFDNF